MSRRLTALYRAGCDLADLEQFKLSFLMRIRLRNIALLATWED